jgi:RimJ/RimL family protein N-acetyltransferase
MQGGSVTRLPAADGFRFRLFTHADIGDLRDLHGDHESMRYMHDSGLPWTDEELHTWVDTWQAEYGAAGYTKWRVEAADGRFLGRAGLSPMPGGEAELGYSLVRREWSKGYATALATIIRDWAFANTDLPYLYGITMPGNVASQRVLQKIGMSYLGPRPFRNGRYEFFRLDRARYSECGKQVATLETGIRQPRSPLPEIPGVERGSP